MKQKSGRVSHSRDGGFVSVKFRISMQCLLYRVENALNGDDSRHLTGCLAYQGSTWPASTT